jgi:hypothetical protein
MVCIITIAPSTITLLRISAWSGPCHDLAGSGGGGGSREQCNLHIPTQLQDSLAASWYRSIWKDNPSAFIVFIKEEVKPA